MSKYGYEVQGNAEEGVVSVLLRLGDVKDRSGEVIYEETQARLFFPGNVIPEEEIATHIREKYEKGDEHTVATFRRIPLSDISEEVEEEVEEAPKPARKPAAKKESAKSASAE